jgi:ABC-2 type transport system permease protein
MLYCVLGAYITLCVPRFFGYTSLVHATDLIGLMVPYLLACIFFGMALSCVVRYRENVMLLVVFTSVPFLFLTGISWPQSNLPALWKYFGYLIPSTFGIRGFLTISSMGGTLQDMTEEYQGLWIQVLVYFFLTCIVYRWQINSARKHALNHLEDMKHKLEVSEETDATK